MAVYVDRAFINASVKNGRATHTSNWCRAGAIEVDSRVSVDISRAKRLGITYEEYRLL